MSQPDRSPMPIRLVRTILVRLRAPWDWIWRKPSGGTSDAGDVQREKLRVQVGVLRSAFGDGVAVAASDNRGRATNDADAAYFYRPGHALVRAERVDEVMRFIDERSESFHGNLERVREPVPGLMLVQLPQRRDKRDHVLATLDELDGSIGPDASGRPVASPDHILYVTTIKAGLCPATEPEHPTSERPVPQARADETAGTGVRVSVVDTGLWTDATTSTTTPWLHGVVADPGDVEVIDPNAIHPYGGHGTFVAGVVRCFAPAAHIQVQGALTHGGAVYESEIVEQLHEALSEDDRPQLVSISAGTHTRKDFALISFEMLADLHRLDGSETLVVAAAGNDASDSPFWPAAFDWVVGVGSVDAGGAVSDYSNVGRWVDVYALGRDHVNAFPVGTYTCYEPPNIGQVRQFGGLAQWSGTSFSTPVVTGLIAARMSANGESPLDAYNAVAGTGTATTDPRGGPIVTVGPLS